MGSDLDRGFSTISLPVPTLDSWKEGALHSRGLWRLLLSSAHGGATTLLEGGGKRHTAQMNCRSCPVWRGRDLHRADARQEGGRRLVQEGAQHSSGSPGLEDPHH
nr:uncharacterized protein LOC123479645 isoform X3 [Desmodus rotundus]